MLIPGSISPEVGWLQQALSARGLDDDDDDFVDCIFGPQTKTQVERFQSGDVDLPVDGVVTQDDWESLGIGGPGYDDVPSTCDATTMTAKDDPSNQSAASSRPPAAGSPHHDVECSPAHCETALLDDLA